MKSKKMFFPVVVICAAVLLTAIYSVLSGIAMKPTITEQEFAFSVTYELDGEIKTLEDTYSVHYDRNDGYNNTKTRVYVGKMSSTNEDSSFFVLKKDDSGRIELNTRLYPDYLMGDSEYDYFEDGSFEPYISYYDLEEIEYTDEETLAEHGVKLISYEYPTPIENSFVFSHISILDSGVVLPALLFSFLAWLIILIRVKKDEDYIRKPIDTVSTLFNFLVCFVLLPYFTICAWLLDALGDNESLFNQIFYFIPAITVLGVAASLALRRKQYGVAALLVQFIGPAIFGIIYGIAALQGLA